MARHYLRIDTNRVELACRSFEPEFQVLESKLLIEKMDKEVEELASEASLDKTWLTGKRCLTGRAFKYQP